MALNAERKAKFTAPENLGTKVTPDEIKRYIHDCLVVVGAPSDHAKQMADLLYAADYRGHYSHGLNRVEMYVNDIESKVCDPNATPIVEKESVSTALVDGRNGLGAVIGNFSMALAMKKAKETGIGWVSARRSNHFGIAGWYAMQASKEGLIGMGFTNTSPMVAPTRAKVGGMGTNPIAVAAPTNSGDFVLDMATSSVAFGKVEVQRRKCEPIPSGWAIDSEGKITTDPNATNALMPLGGPEINSGYKGYGLAMMVEMFCGILGGALYGNKIRTWMTMEKEANLGQCFVAIDPSYFAPGFTDRMQDLTERCRNLDRADPEKPVLIPGDPERANCEKVDREGTINYHINQIKDSYLLAKVLGVSPMQST